MEVDTLPMPVPQSFAGWKPKCRRMLSGNKFFEEGNLACSMSSLKYSCINVDSSDSKRLMDIQCEMGGCHKTFSSLLAYEMHYAALHRYVCTECHRCFPTQHLVDLHIIEWHSSLFSLQSNNTPMYRCLVESCTESFMTHTLRRSHLVSRHKYPSNYRFLKSRDQVCNVAAACETMTAEAGLSASSSTVSSDAIVHHGIVSTTNAASSVSNTTAACSTAHSAEPVNNEQIDASAKLARRFTYRIPENICFGQGSTKAFSRRAAGRGSDSVSVKNKNKSKTKSKQSGNQSNCVAMETELS